MGRAARGLAQKGGTEEDEGRHETNKEKGVG